jgi:hypothetical protein
MIDGALGIKSQDVGSGDQATGRIGDRREVFFQQWSNDFSIEIMC